MDKIVFKQHIPLARRYVPMMRNFFTVVAAFALAGAVVTAQDPANPAPQPPASPPATSPAPAATPDTQNEMRNQILTGCLTQGTGPNVFVLSNARLSTQARTEPGKSYVVAMTDIGNLRTQLNHEVRITGRAEEKTLPAPKPGETLEEKDLPKLTASAITSVANTCSTAG
jgi:hypothetical protein